MLKIKVLDSPTSNEIEEQVNKFINYEKFEIIDIKMNVTQYGDGYRFTATILYENLLDDNLSRILDKYKDKEDTLNQIKLSIKKGLLEAKDVDNIVSEIRQEYFNYIRNNKKHGIEVE